MPRRARNSEVGATRATVTRTVPAVARRTGTSGWRVYMVRCRDDSLYTGITNDLARRLLAHNAGTASRYTRSRRPVTLVYQEVRRTKGTALRREAAIKKLDRTQKERLIDGLS